MEKGAKQQARTLVRRKTNNERLTFHAQESMVRSTPSRASKSRYSQETNEKSAAEGKMSPPKKGKTVWTPAEDESLLAAVAEDRKRREAVGDEDDEEDWDEIAKSVPGKSAVQCLRRYMEQVSKAEAAVPAPAAGTRRARSEREDDESESPASKKAKTEPADEDDWTEEEVELLKKLVEHYSDSKCLFVSCNGYLLKIVCVEISRFVF